MSHVTEIVVREPDCVVGGERLAVIAGPCLVEDLATTASIAEQLAEICAELHVPFIFKASYDKANRTSINSARGPGWQKGLEILAEVRETVKSFTSMVDDLMVQKKRLLADSEEVVVRLSCEIARRIVTKMAEMDEEMILEIVRNALGHLGDKQKVTIRVNPADAETLRSHGDELAEATGAGSTVEIAEDVRIKRGGCLIEGESGSVEAQLDRQVDMIEKALMEAVHAG